MADQMGGGAAVDTTVVPPAPPPSHRRPRVREVSSRFMSPLVQSNSTPAPTPHPSDFPRPKSVHRRHPSKCDENLNPEANRGGVGVGPEKSISTVQRKPHQQRARSGEFSHHSEIRVSSRPDTPILTCTDRIVQSRYRHNRSNSLSSSGGGGGSGCAAVTAAARLLQEATSDVEKKLSRISTSSTVDDSDSCSTTSNQGSSSCPNSPLRVPVTKLRTAATDVRSSMPDVEKWLTDRSFDNSSKDCARSLNFSSFSKIGGGGGGGGVSRPPHPSSCMRSAMDSRKLRKVSNHHEEEVHSLKMLSNHYLQWRFANAKAEAFIEARKHETEIKFYSLGGQLSDLRDNVKKKRTELAVLRRSKTLTNVVEAQMPYLEEWSNLEEDYCNSLSGAANALLSSSVRVPVSGDVRVDIGQLEEALCSASKVVESIGSHIQRFIHKAEGIDTLVSELARMVGGEKALTEECGYLLSKIYSSQVNECSLRGALMQLDYCNNRLSHNKSEELVSS